MLTSPIHGLGKRRNIGVGEVCYTVGRNTVGDVGGNAGSNANIITATSAEVGDIDGNNKGKKEMQNHKIMQISCSLPNLVHNLEIIWKTNTGL